MRGKVMGVQEEEGKALWVRGGQNTYTAIKTSYRHAQKAQGSPTQAS